MRKFTRRDQRLLAVWAIACAKRVLPLFERAAPDDERPRMALAAGRAWIRTGVFRMADIRGASLGAHAAAKAVTATSAACLAAHAAGQAVATAHVTQHAYGAAYYALRAIAAVAPRRVERERAWQEAHLPSHLRRVVMPRLVVRTRDGDVTIRLRKGRGF